MPRLAELHLRGPTLAHRGLSHHGTQDQCVRFGACCSKSNALSTTTSLEVLNPLAACSETLRTDNSDSALRLPRFTLYPLPLGPKTRIHGVDRDHPTRSSSAIPSTRIPRHPLPFLLGPLSLVLFAVAIAFTLAASYGSTRDTAAEDHHSVHLTQAVGICHLE